MSDKQVLHLTNVAACLSSISGLSRLRSHLLWVCSTVGGKQVNQLSRICPNCCHDWHSGKFSMKILSSRSPGPRMGKILRKIEKNPEKMSRVELSLMKRYQQHHSNKLVLCCNTCQRRTAMQFHKTLTEEPCAIPKGEDEVTSSTKKKRKKHRFAGLNVSAVLSATPSPLPASLKISSFSKSMSNAKPTPSTATKEIPQTVCMRSSLNESLTMTPKTSRPNQTDSHQKKKGHKSIKQKMNLLREEIKEAEQNRVKEEFKALGMRNLNIKKNNKLQDFLSKREKDVHFEDRINSLLQL